MIKYSAIAINVPYYLIVAVNYNQLLFVGNKDAGE